MRKQYWLPWEQISPFDWWRRLNTDKDEPSLRIFLERCPYRVRRQYDVLIACDGLKCEATLSAKNISDAKREADSMLVRLKMRIASIPAIPHEPKGD